MRGSSVDDIRMSRGPAWKLNQSQSESIRVNPSQSESIRVNPSQSESIRVSRSQSESIRVNQSQSESIRVNQSQSESIRVNQSQSASRPCLAAQYVQSEQPWGPTMCTCHNISLSLNELLFHFTLFISFNKPCLVTLIF